MSKQNISATLNDDLVKKIDALAKETERNRSWLINKAVELYFEELEDLETAKARLNDERLSPSKLRKAVGV